MSSQLAHPEVHFTDTVLHALQRAVSGAPNQVFLDFGGDTYTYREFDVLSNRFAHALAELGVQPGHTVATVLDNNIDQLVTWVAANKLGAAASSKMTLSRVRMTYCRTALGSSDGVTGACRSVTSTWPAPITPSASILGSSCRKRISRPRSAPAFSIAIRMSVPVSLLSSISPDTVCDALITVAISSCAA